MLAAINRKPVDRIPTDIWATGEVHRALRSHFGDQDSAMRELHVDGFKGAGAVYCGPTLLQMPQGESIDMWGNRFRASAYEHGTYMELYAGGLGDAQTIDDLNRYRWPQADWFDYSKMREQAEKGHQTHAVQCGYMAPFYYHNNLRGLEQSLMDPLVDPEFTHVLLEKLSHFFLTHHRKMFEACDGLIDVAQVTDDLGSQTGPMIGLELYREFYKPHHKRMIDLCHEFGIKVLHHDDGSCRVFLPDLVEMGIDILNPIQWNCPGMETEGLKRDFGQKICFHGGIENQKILPFGTTDDVRTEVRHCIDTLASDGTGYILASCHCLQPNTPLENIIAMYDEAWHYGKRG